MIATYSGRLDDEEQCRTATTSSEEHETDKVVSEDKTARGTVREQAARSSCLGPSAVYDWSE